MLLGKFLVLTVGIFVLSLAVAGCEAIETFLPRDTPVPGAPVAQEPAASTVVPPTAGVPTSTAAPTAPTVAPAASTPAPTATAVPVDTPVPTAIPTATPLPPPSFTLLNSGTRQRLRDVGWKPDGSYALLVGNRGTLLKYDGSSFTPVASGTIADLYSVSWKPDGSSALITGGSGNTNSLVMVYDEDSLTTVTEALGPNLLDSEWKPDGSYAVVVGSRGFVKKFDGTDLTPLDAPPGNFSGVGFKADGSLALMTDTGPPNTDFLIYDGETFGPRIPTGVASNLQDVAWKSDGSYGLVVGTGGALLKFDGTEVTSHYPEKNVAFFGVDWRMDDSQALVVGGIPPFSSGQPTASIVLSYDGQDSQVLEPGLANGKILYGVAWKPDGAYGLIMGDGGTVLRFQPSTPAGLPAIARLPRVDQSYSPGEYTFGQGFGNFDVGQSFVPRLPDLVAVEMPVCTGTVPDEVELQIRDGTYDGPLLRSVTLTLDAPFCSFGEEKFSRFQFDEPVSLVPGQTYIIRLHSVSPSDAGTFGAPHDYSGGHLFRFENGQPFPGEDLGFRTYAKPGLSP